MQIKITSHDSRGAPVGTVSCDWDSFKRENADGIDATEFADIELMLRAGQSYTLAGHAGSYDIIATMEVA